MSRKIKFRAWDIDNKKYEYDIAIRPINRIIGVEIFNNEMYPVEFRGIIEQYTGLKDKNGREIYEGDIIAQTLIDDPFGKRYPNYIVYWCEEYLSWGVKDTWGDDGNDSDLHFFIAERQKCEVIGNIHENPELLGDNK